MKKLLDGFCNIVVNIIVYLFNNSKTKLRKKLEEIINIETVGKEEKFDVKSVLYKVDEFYRESLNEYCKKNKLNLLEELTLRKNEIEHDLNYIISIYFGILTGIIATVVMNILPILIKLIIEGNILGGLGITLVVLLSGLFIPLTKYMIYWFRKDSNTSIKIIEQYELELINKVIDLEISEVIKSKNTV